MIKGEFLHSDNKVVTNGSLLPWIDCFNPEDAALYNSDKAGDCLIKYTTKIIWPDKPQIKNNLKRKPPTAE